MRDSPGIPKRVPAAEAGSSHCQSTTLLMFVLGGFPKSANNEEMTYYTAIVYRLIHQLSSGYYPHYKVFLFISIASYEHRTYTKST